jgi:hypothetical protein
LHVGGKHRSSPHSQFKSLQGIMYLYGREEGKIGLFDKGVVDASEYPKVLRGRRKGAILLPKDGVLSKL